MQALDVIYLNLMRKCIQLAAAVSFRFSTTMPEKGEQRNWVIAVDAQQQTSSAAG